MKQFKSRAEVSALPDFKKEQPISAESYVGLVGWYAFEKEEMHCCSLKESGTLCRTPHKKGWVARVSGGALTIIGGDCAKKKYDADSTIMRDINLAQKSIDDEAAKQRLAELLTDRDSARAAVAAAFERLDGRRRALQGFMEAVGRRNQSRLEELARTSGEVVVEGRTPAEVDSDGEVIRDARIVRIQLPPISSIAVCKPSYVTPMADDLRALRKLYDEADALIESGGQKGRRALGAGLARTDSSVAAAEDAVRAIDAFLSSDLTAACFLVNDWKDRSRMGRLAIERSGAEGDPKAWIQRIEAGLRRKYNVTKIVIGVSR
ncbi:hypothetical protein N5J29_09180 [Stenotrophomonas sp. GD03680]|uniref:hypothetical protein n=1 Tax=Stenotrophomonas sp. GD03680 TaxID=2975365 RepID=UPI00244C9003|nr:hypothetical protein [Stenotrophomonas sp. GD03680]MDH2022928.1 hypothetical protein [Stenotrophomonas sp. GD03680]